jgi:hypothetical protein
MLWLRVGLYPHLLVRTLGLDDIDVCDVVSMMLGAGGAKGRKRGCLACVMPTERSVLRAWVGRQP